MSYLSDFFDDEIPSPTHGGYRPNSGRKDKETEDSAKEHYVKYNEARARNEAAKAELNELDLKVKTKAYLPREAFVEASATAIATFAQACRTLPDALESKGIPSDVCEKVSEAIDAALTSLADELDKFVNEQSN